MRPTDADAVAAVHLESWQSAYRGLYRDAFLDGAAAANRLALWRARLATPGDGTAGLVVEDAGQVIGFAYLDRDDDPGRGPLLDNLHVRPATRGRGLGLVLLKAVAREIDRRAWPPRLHLWVFEANTGARRFYERYGGRPIERILYDAADGGAYPAWCYAWDDLTPLLAADAAP